MVQAVQLSAAQEIQQLRDKLRSQGLPGSSGMLAKLAPQLRCAMQLLARLSATWWHAAHHHQALWT